MPNLSEFILFYSSCPKRLEVISEILMNIKERIDIKYKIDMPKEMVFLRRLIIDLYTATKELHTNIINYNDELVRKYNTELIQILNSIE